MDAYFVKVGGLGHLFLIFFSLYTIAFYQYIFHKKHTKAHAFKKDCPEFARENKYHIPNTEMLSIQDVLLQCDGRLFLTALTQQHSCPKRRDEFSCRLSLDHHSLPRSARTLQSRSAGLGQDLSGSERSYVPADLPRSE